MAVRFENVRRIEKTITGAGVTPTVPASNDHTDGTWLVTDIYEAELCINITDGIVYTRIGNTIVDITKSITGTSVIPLALAWDEDTTEDDVVSTFMKHTSTGYLYLSNTEIGTNEDLSELFKSININSEIKLINTIGLNDTVTATVTEEPEEVTGGVRAKVTLSGNINFEQGNKIAVFIFSSLLTDGIPLTDSSTESISGSSTTLKAAREEDVTAIKANTVKRSYPLEDEQKLGAIEEGAQVNTVNSVNGEVGDVDIHIPSDSAELSYDNTESGLSAENPKDAIDEVQGNLETHEADEEKHLTSDQNAALDAANSPNASNPIATVDDIKLLDYTELTNSNDGDTLSNGSAYRINASADTFSVSLPASPSAGDKIRFYSEDLTNNVTLVGNGKNIEGETSYVIGVNNINGIYEVIFNSIDDEWKVKEISPNIDLNGFVYKFDTTATGSDVYNQTIRYDFPILYVSTYTLNGEIGTLIDYTVKVGDYIYLQSRVRKGISKVYTIKAIERIYSPHSYFKFTVSGGGDSLLEGEKINVFFKTAHLSVKEAPVIPDDLGVAPTVADIQEILDYAKSIDQKLRDIGLFTS